MIFEIMGIIIIVLLILILISIPGTSQIIKRLDRIEKLLDKDEYHSPFGASVADGRRKF